MRSHDAEEEPVPGGRSPDRPLVVVLWWLVGLAINAAFLVVFVVLVVMLARML